MKREDIIAIIPEATEEQVTTMLNAHHSKVKTWKDKFDSVKDNPTAADLQTATERAEQLQRELDALKNADAVRQIREKVAGEKKLPASLLTADTEEACAAQADAILAFAKPDIYPNVKDGGSAGVGTPSTDTGKLFANWAETQL